MKTIFFLEDTNKFYSERYSTENTIDLSKLSWFPVVAEPTIPYELTPFTQEDIVQTLKHKSPNSAPGDDEIIYSYLSKLPSVHEFIATLFTHIWEKSQAPKIWAKSRIILVPKEDENEQTQELTTFRMGYS